MTTVVIEEDAQDQIFEIGSWWWTNRLAARTLFADELENALQELAQSPRIGPLFRAARHPGVRRLLMPKSAHWVYYVHDDRHDVVHVLAVWGAPKGDVPPLNLRRIR